ncbi:hypothetical protein GCM10010403_48700 [Glycomyces rutgersensis]|uniref:Uncharacterized protein n=1 Tax=Glycomyces rutgersensis TaxID=58115 RepID=A0ABN3GD22_9ACTN
MVLRALDDVRGVLAEEDRVEEDPVRDPVHGLHGLFFAADLGRVEHDRDPLGPDAAQRLDGEAVREVEVVHGRERGGGLGAARRVVAVAVAEVRRAPRLVEGPPGVDAVGEAGADDRGVVAEALGGLALGPAAAVLKGLREVPVVERRHRLDAGLDELVDEPVVEVEALGVGRSGAVGLDARPGDGEAVGVDAEGLHEGDVLVDPVVVVAGHGAGLAAPGLAGGRREGVPNGLAPAVLGRRALDLVGGRGGSPQEALGKGQLRHRYAPFANYSAVTSVTAVGCRAPE